MASGRLEHQIEREESIKRSIVNQPDYVRGYYFSMSGRESTTKETYIRVISHFLHYVKEEIGVDVSDPNNFTLDVINMYFDACRYVTKDGESSKATVATLTKKYAALSSFFRYLLGAKKVTENPMEHVVRAKGKDKVKRVYLDETAVGDIFDKIQHQIDNKRVNWTPIRDMAIMSIFLQTGIRATALTEINMEDVHYIFDGDGNFDYILLDITDKEDEHYEKRIIGAVAERLMNWIEAREKFLGETECDALFVNKYKGRISYKGVSGVVTHYAPEIDGKQVTPHKLRATYARTLYNATGDIYFVQQQMKHKSPVTTTIYVGETDNGDSKATEIMNNIFF